MVRISQKASILLRQLYRPFISECRFYATLYPNSQECRDPAPLFFDRNVQKMLKTLTRVDYEKVSRPRMDGNRMQPPVYKFMTDEELSTALAEAKMKMNRRLQMPPVVKTRSEEVQVISKDPALQGCVKHKYVFTDITFGVSDRNRVIVIRDLDGTLRHALSSERDRYNQVYFPQRGKEMHRPKMFDGEYLTNLLDQGEYEYIMDRACIQFDPDDPNYQEVAGVVYSHVKSTGRYDILRSTRHFGPMAFYFAWIGQIDDLLVEILENRRIDEAATLIRLYYKVRPSTSSSENKIEANSEDVEASKHLVETDASKEKIEDSISNMELIEHYAKTDSSRSHHIERAIAAYKKLEEEKKKVAEGIKNAHGFTEDSTNDCT